MNDAIRFGVGCEKLTTGVIDFSNPFKQQQALFRSSEVEAAARMLFQQAVVVAFRVVTKQRQHEAVFTSRRSVAITRVATRPHEDGNDVVLEADWSFLPRASQAQYPLEHRARREEEVNGQDEKALSHVRYYQDLCHG